MLEKKMLTRKLKRLKEGDAGHWRMENTAGYRVFFVGGKEGVSGLDPETGALVFKYDTESSVTSQVVAHWNNIYFGCYNGKFYAVNMETRELKWSMDIGDKILSSVPAVSETLILFGSEDRHFYAVCLDSGEIRWKFKGYGNHSCILLQ
ncbi:PQQ-binding-like beta-propeller repeat protein [Thermodesulfobacteriota bacterium]